MNHAVSLKVKVLMGLGGGGVIQKSFTWANRVENISECIKMASSTFHFLPANLLNADHIIRKPDENHLSLSNSVQQMKEKGKEKEKMKSQRRSQPNGCPFVLRTINLTQLRLQIQQQMHYRILL